MSAKVKAAIAFSVLGVISFLMLAFNYINNHWPNKEHGAAIGLGFVSGCCFIASALIIAGIKEKQGNTIERDGKD